jgi:hypothetical protein
MPSVVTMTGPGTATVTDDAAAAILLQNSQQLIWNTKIFAALSQINNSLQTIKDNSKVTAKATSDLQIAIASVATATSSATVIKAAEASSNIKKNNFEMQVTKASLEKTGQEVPKEPPMVEQIKEVVKDSMTMNSIAVAEGAVTNFITTQAASIATWIVETEVYRGITEYVKKAKDTLLTAIFPPTPAAVESGAKVLAGDPTPPTMT